MSADPVNSPIQRLDFDVLWHIFDLNADIFDDDRALITTLATSYVCHNWRSLVLNSTSIWAHRYGPSSLDVGHCRREQGTDPQEWDSAAVDKNRHPALLFAHKKADSGHSGNTLGPSSKTRRNYPYHLMNQSPLRRPALHLESLRVDISSCYRRPRIQQSITVSVQWKCTAAPQSSLEGLRLEISRQFHGAAKFAAWTLASN